MSLKFHTKSILITHSNEQSRFLQTIRDGNKTLEFRFQAQYQWNKQNNRSGCCCFTEQQMVCIPRWVRSGQKESNDIKRGGRSLSSGRSSKNCCFFVLAEGLGQVKTDSWMPLRSINVKLSRNLAICFQHLTIRVNPNGIFNLHSIFMKKTREVFMIVIVATIGILCKGS